MQVHAGWRYEPVNVCTQYSTHILHQQCVQSQTLCFQEFCVGAQYSCIHWFMWAHYSSHKSPETWLEFEIQSHGAASIKNKNKNSTLHILCKKKYIPPCSILTDFVWFLFWDVFNLTSSASFLRTYKTVTEKKKKENPENVSYSTLPLNLTTHTQVNSGFIHKGAEERKTPWANSTGVSEREKDRQKKEVSLVKFISQGVSGEPRCTVAIATGIQHLLKGMRKGFMIHIQTTTAWESKYTEVNCHPQTVKLTAVRRRGQAENK